jgi:hypothetical protein
MPMLEILLGPVLQTINTIIDRIIPDPKAAAEAKLEMLKMQQAGDLKQLDADLQIAVGQLKVNEAEANSKSPFAAGWRPLIGYICGASLGWNFVGYPMANWAAAAFHLGITAPPMLDTGPLMTVLMGMLGIGTLRTIEKIKGVAS